MMKLGADLPFSSVPKCRGVKENAPGGKLSTFPKMGGGRLF